MHGYTTVCFSSHLLADTMFLWDLSTTGSQSCLTKATYIFVVCFYRVWTGFLRALAAACLVHGARKAVWASGPSVCQLPHVGSWFVEDAGWAPQSDARIHTAFLSSQSVQVLAAALVITAAPCVAVNAGSGGWREGAPEPAPMSADLALILHSEPEHWPRYPAVGRSRGAHGRGTGGLGSSALAHVTEHRKLLGAVATGDKTFALCIWAFCQEKPLIVPL